MSEYVYNPSKKVTELLSNYLEFDPEQLKLGIWSGDLSLNDVSLRQDAVYPLLNKHLNAAAPGLHARPPMRFKLVRGTIGSLEMKIPWKRLVWGSGQVNVKLRNVVLVVSLESYEETEQRLKGSGEDTDELFPDISDSKEVSVAEEGDVSQVPKALERQFKQKRLREAERRQLQGRLTASWLEHSRKKDRENIERILARDRPEDEQVGHIDTWLKSAVKDFFWRFYAGLAMNVENLKIILVQDGVEVGLIMPSIQVKSSNETGLHASMHETSDDSSTGGKADVNASFQSEYDDGEHVDKSIKFLGVGVYIRAIPRMPKSRESHHFATDVATKEFVLRPVDFVFEYTFFYPHPPEKRKRRSSVKQGEDQTATTVGSGDLSVSEGSSKRRRGKREKMIVQAQAEVSRPSAIRLASAVTPTRASATASNPRPDTIQNRAATVGARLQAPLHRRRQSMAFSTPIQQQPQEQVMRSTVFETVAPDMALPLVRPDNIAGAYIAASGASSHLTARFDSKLSIGSIEVVCSSRHYELFSSLVATSHRVRNGRPSRSIGSVIDGAVAMQRALTVSTPLKGSTGKANASPSSSTPRNNKSQPHEVRLRLQSVWSERSDLVRLWWRYALRAVIWELRQRERLRKTFHRAFLSFSWDRQQYRRKEYVDVYIASRLDKRQRTDLSFLSQEHDETLLAIEDELTVEQILLYRSLARAVYVRGGNSMPESILELRDSMSPQHDLDDSLASSGIDNDAAPLALASLRDAPSLLALLERMCSTARKRREAGMNDELPPFEMSPTRVGAGRIGQHTTLDESTAAPTVDTRPGRTGRKRAFQIAPLLKSAAGNHSLMISFSMEIRKLEFSVVQESDFLLDSGPPSLTSAESDESERGEESSDVSGLTDDQRFFGEDGEGQSHIATEEIEEVPIASSTDFLIFSAPENVLLRVIVYPVTLTVFARGGGARNVNLTVGSVVAMGDGGDRALLSVGAITKGGPVPQVGLRFGSSRSVSNNDWRSSDVTDALAMSLVVSRSVSTLQCDTTVVKAQLQPVLLGKLRRFLRLRSVACPRELLEKNALEEVRAFVLDQNRSMPLSAVDCSIRVHGFEVKVPVQSASGSASSDEPTPHGLTIRAGIVELYSGSAIGALSMTTALDSMHGTFDNGQGRTRSLRMLNIDERTSFRSSILSRHWVLATSGVDCMLDGEGPIRSFLEAPVEAELLCTINANSVGDLNRAKKELFVELSPVHVMLSPDKIERLSQVLPGTQSVARSPVAEPITPRLDVLSQYMDFATEVHVAKFCLSLAKEMDQGLAASQGTSELYGYDDHVPALSHHGRKTVDDKLEAARAAIRAFLNVVASFDLSFPHEEALASGMQICIDRLTGLGVALEEAWEVTNTALLNFLEDMALDDGMDGEPQSFVCNMVDDESTSASMSVSPDVMLRVAVERTASRALEGMSTSLAELETAIDHALVFDVPDGVKLSFVSLFYDKHVTLSVPTVFVTDGSGVHLVRITPPEGTKQGGSNDSVSDASDENVLDNTSILEEQPGLILRAFLVDKDHPFGKGGLPLSILATNADLSVFVEDRAREYVYDAEIGEIELLVAGQICEELLSALTGLFRPFLDRHREKGEKQAYPGEGISGSWLAAQCTTSILFTSDDLTPFSRVRIERQVVKRRCLLQTEELLCSSAQSVSLTNLTSEGEVYQEPIALLPSLTEPTPPFSVVVTSTDHGPFADVRMHSFRVVFLQQFLSECTQYFLSGSYGLGRFLASLKQGESDSSCVLPGKRGRFRYAIEVVNSSVFLPRSIRNADIVAVEIVKGSMASDVASESFAVPTAKSELRVPGFLSSGVERGDFSGQQVSRLVLDLEDFRILSSISDDFPTGDGAISPSFRFFFALAGRAEAGVPVYSQRCSAGDFGTEIDLFAENEKTASRCWREITSSSSSLQVVADRLPHLRLLVSNMLRDKFSSPLSLEIRQSQLCLFLSLWYSNMQELPVSFPFSIHHLESLARGPAAPSPFPEYGTSDFVRLLNDKSGNSSEICVAFNHLGLCFVPDLEGEDHSLEGSCLRLELRSPVIHVSNDLFGISRIGSGCSGISFVDEGKAYEMVLLCGNLDSNKASWADATFGLERDFGSLTTSLPQSFQMTACMVPGWSIYNLGINDPVISLSDLTSIFNFLSFVSAYFKDPKLGSPVLEAAERAKAMKLELARLASGDDNAEVSNTATSVDFRLWMCRPQISIPCEPFHCAGPGVRLLGDGFWYRHSSLSMFATHEVVVQGLQLVFDEKCVVPIQSRARESKSQNLVDGLTFALRMDFNEKSNHTDLSLEIPHANPSSCSMVSSRIVTLPAEVGPTIICTPASKLDRCLGASVCEITCVIERIPLVLTALLNMFKGSTDDASTIGEGGSVGLGPGEVAGDATELSTSHADMLDASTFSYTARINDFRVFAIDPVLGRHLPIAVVSVESIEMTASRFSSSPHVSVAPRGPPLEDLQILVRSTLWADYFKLGLTRSWEPLLEAYSFQALYERSGVRGSGLSVTSDSPLHVNVSGALLVILDEVIDSVRRSIACTFSDASDAYVAKANHGEGDRIAVHDGASGVDLVHELAVGIGPEDRVAFSIRNLSGQRLRLKKPREPSGGMSAVVAYVEHLQATEITFLPSISRIKNMAIEEVDFPGLPNSSSHCGSQDTTTSRAIDLQLPGFHWIEGVQVDTFGRTFADLKPRSPIVRAKMRADWRLANALRLLVEVGLQNGGRQVSVRSLFSIVNRTSHKVSILLHPDPAFEPTSDNSDTVASSLMPDAELEPGAPFQVPILLMEMALGQEGSHLGSIWLRPDALAAKESLESLESALNEEGAGTGAIDISYTSRPVQLAKIVSESSLIFTSQQRSEFNLDDAKSGIQVACPVVRGTDRLSPFCYAIEVGRSPLVKARTSLYQNKAKGVRQVHGPVAYTLSIHPTFVVVNLLPERGRFELMHAVRRTVLWFADLEPGEQVSVHSVGLDEPLLLLINLGFCKTPVGEGALVHHGVDVPRGTRDNLGLKSIGKAGKAVTKQVGKALTKIGESPDKRGHEKMFLVQNPQFLTAAQQAKDQRITPEAKADLGLDTDETGIENAGGKTYRLDTVFFFPEDVAAETVVVDSIGQRLTLNIENIRGGGGQRRISVFSPFWIVNTTEHALRYKQEKSATFVSGTVSSPSKDGSLPLSGGRAQANYEAHHGSPRHIIARVPLNKGTIFAGTHGALATSPGQCELPAEEVVSLIEADLSLERLADLAFMFNFNEGVLSLGNQKLCVQLWDGSGATRYASDWSQGFSLDSVGFSQVVGMHCKDGRALELTVLVTVAPGFLSGYTKIVRFLPRYVIVNSLPYPIRLWQDSSIFRPPAADNTADAATTERKWRIANGPSKRSHRKVNQYEALWGRETTLDQRSGLEGMSNTTRAHQSALYVLSAGPSEAIPFTLPDSRGERQLRIGLGGAWNLTASVSADVPGEHTLKVTKSMDLKTTPHVSTRGSPEYEVLVRPGDFGSCANELGLWFETEWGSDRKLIVKAVKKESFAFQETDVHVGDELLSIDHSPVARMTFAEAMGELRNRLQELAENANADSGRSMRRSSLRLVGLGRASNSVSGSAVQAPPLTLRFRTVEERLRRVRLKAAKSNGESSSVRRESDALASVAENPSVSRLAADYIKVELRAVQHSLFLVLREESSIPYRIHNRTIGSTIYYRQRGCEGHPWQLLKPGQSDDYSWEEPLRQKRLTVRVASGNALSPTIGDGSDENDSITDAIGDISEIAKRIEDRRGKRSIVGQIASRKVKDEEDAVFSQSINVRLEEIGFRDVLPCHSDDVGPGNARKTKYLELDVDVEGATRVLVVQDLSVEDDLVQLKRHIERIKSKLVLEEQRQAKLINLKEALERVSRPEEQLVEEAKAVMDDFPEDARIMDCHQIVVEVLEAMGLSPDSFVGTCNPYVEVGVKGGRTTRLFRKRDVRRTYYVRKTVSPTWNSQRFVFDVPKEAASMTRGHSIKVCLRNFRPLGHNHILGAAQIELHSARDESPLEGWFPLAGRTGRHELENPLSHWGRGSIRLRLQWVYTTPALFDYFLQITEKLLSELRDSLDGMELQLKNKQEAEARRRDEVDGFKRVRIHDLLSLSSGQKKRPSITPVKRNKSNRVLSVKKTDQTGVRDEISRFVLTGLPKNGLRAATAGAHVSPAVRASSIRRVESAASPLTQLARENLNKLEDLITERRKTFSRHRLSTRENVERRTTFVHPSGHAWSISVASLKSWPSAQALFRDGDLIATIDGGEIKVAVRNDARRIAGRSEMDVDTQWSISTKLVPERAPFSYVDPAKEIANAYERSRLFFERATDRKIRAVLHTGGWLVIRPFTALNLPDSYSGMFVRIRYGPDILVSECVDARVCPTWHSPYAQPLGNDEEMSTNHRPIYKRRSRSATTRSSDMHIHVAPQKTSGSLRLSVVGEKSHANLHSKTELGIIHLPLGATIAACIDAARGASDGTNSATHSYMRWFPLMDPKDVVPVEGDLGRSLRPPESEKETDSSFHEYFAPCIQLAIVWVPDSEDVESDRIQSPSFGNLPLANPMVTSYFVADVGCLSAALIDSQRAFELVSLSMADIETRYWTTKAKSRMGLSIGWLQIDQQDDEAREPVIFAPTPTDFIGPVIQMLAVKDNARSVSDVITFDFIDVSIAEYDLTLEESILFDLFDFISSVQLRRGFLVKATQSKDDTYGQRAFSSGDSLMKSYDMNDQTDLASLLKGAEAATSSRRLYIEQLFLGVVKVNLSYLKGKKQGWELTSQGMWVEKQLDGGTRRLLGSEVFTNPSSTFHDKSDSLLKWSLLASNEDAGDETTGQTSQNLPQLLAALFPNVSDAPIRLQGKALNHIFESPGEILQSIKKFYVNETLRQVYRIIGSLDFVGNPTMLFTSFVSGFRDLVMTPSAAFMKTPTDPSRVGIGVAKGALSLFSHSASGFFGFWAKVSAAAGQGLSWLTLDPDYRTWHRDKIVTEATNLNRVWKRRGVQSVRMILTRPVIDLLYGVCGGVIGIFYQPVKGYRRNGTAGLVMGVAGGVSGAVVKPLIGVLDAMAHFAASIHDIAKSVNVLDKRLQPALRRRLPYTFGIMLILAPFDSTAARAVFLLKVFPPKRLRDSGSSSRETLVHVEVLPNISSDTYMIVSNYRVALIRLRKEASGSLTPSMCWEISHSSSGRLSSRVSEQGHSGIALTLTVTKPETDAETMRSPAIPTLDANPNVDAGEATETVATGGNEDASVQLPSSATPVSPLELDGNPDGQYHGTARGEKGEVLEWYSVLAEYQYRPQLARFHNAISCITGNVADVIRDPSLGRPGSTEGYTSFGMFFFSETELLVSEPNRDHELLNSLEVIPWLDKRTFVKLNEMSDDEQRSFLAQAREERSFAQELESSTSEGGPAWLIEARAQALYLNARPISPMSSMEEDHFSPLGERRELGRLGLPKKIKRWTSTPLATIPDGGILDAATDLFHLKKTPFGRKGAKWSSPSTTKESTKEVPAEATPVSPIPGPVAPPHTNEPSVNDVNSSILSDSFHSATDMSPSDSLRDPNDFTRSTARGPEPSDSDLTGDSRRTGDVFYSSRGSLDEESSSALSKKPSFKRASLDWLRPSSRSIGPSPSASRETQQTQAAVAGGWTEYEGARHIQRHTEDASDVRLSRMEGLMERLLIFSSEQALRAPGSGQSVEHQMLLDQIAELRQNLLHRANDDAMTQRQVFELRQEIADLKATLHLPPPRSDSVGFDSFECPSEEISSPPETSAQTSLRPPSSVSHSNLSDDEISATPDFPQEDTDDIERLQPASELEELQEEIGRVRSNTGSSSAFASAMLAPQDAIDVEDSCNGVDSLN